MSPTSTHDHQVATSPLSLQPPGVPISAHTKELVIIAKKRNHTRIQTQVRRVS